MPAQTTSRIQPKASNTTSRMRQTQEANAGAEVAPGLDSPVLFAPVRPASTATVATHAQLLRQVSDANPAARADLLQRFQAQYGNRYVQRVLDVARKEAHDGEVEPDIEESIQRAKGGGQPFDAAVRHQMESTFDAGLDHVRVHADSEADTLNRALNARAFTVGNDIFFRQGAYNPGASSGRELIAHETTHVVQRGGGQIRTKLTVNEPGDKFEQEADAAAKAVMRAEQGATTAADESEDLDEEEAVQGQLLRQPEKDEETTQRSRQRQPEEDEGETAHAQMQRQIDEDEKPTRTDPQISAVQRNTSTGAARTPIQTEPAASSPKWQSSPDQKAFREQVLSAHIARSSKRKGQPLPDLDGAELATVPGTGVKMRSDAASAAGSLLAAANQALAAAQQVGDKDAAETLRLSARSGYRGRSDQERVWRQYFPKHYNNTAARRATLPGGEHGDSAIEEMVSYISPKVAAPGFSNHQAGVAIDFWQERTKGNRIENSTDNAAVKMWQKSWFFDWLQQNAGSYQFQEYNKEPWHWVYGGQLSGDAGTSTRAALPAQREEPSPERAVHPNDRLGEQLGWASRIDEIVNYFQSLGYLPPLMSPDASTFAEAVREYQQQRPPLGADGILGPDTWRRLRQDLGYFDTPRLAYQGQSVLLNKLTSLGDAATKEGAGGDEFKGVVDEFKDELEIRLGNVAPEKPLPPDLQLVMKALMLWSQDPGNQWGEGIWDSKDLRMTAPEYATVPASQYKCNAYVAEVLYQGLDVVFNAHESEIQKGKYFPYRAKEWGDPKSIIPKFEVVDKPQMGDIWSSGTHVGIYLGSYNNKNLYISARDDGSGVFGLEDVQKTHGIQIKYLPDGGVFRRYIGL